MIGCLLDMDGVLCDFIGQMSDEHDKENPYLDKRNKGKYDMAKIWDMSDEEFWKPADAVSFWSEMAKLPDADELVDLCEKKFGKDNVAILTAPSQHPASVVGKIKWIAHNYPQFNRRMILTPAKDFLAHDENVLIDDKDDNIKDFITAGGRAVLMPRDWNSGHRLAKSALNEVKAYLDKMNIIKNAKK